MHVGLVFASEASAAPQCEQDVETACVFPLTLGIFALNIPPGICKACQKVLTARYDDTLSGPLKEHPLEQSPRQLKTSAQALSCFGGVDIQMLSGPTWLHVNCFGIGHTPLD